MEIALAVLVFAAKTFLVVLGIVVVLGFIMIFALRGRSRPQLEIEDLTQRYKDMSAVLRHETLEKKQLKKLLKSEKKLKKEEKLHTLPKVFVLDFEGDLRASAVTSLREEITAILGLGLDEKDEVIVRLESPGGMVHSYGLAAAELARIRDKKIRLTICVDKIAASGGYMMSCVADHIVAAPFAVIGSIGVVAQLPNVHRLLAHNRVDYQEVTAGEWKRTVSVFGEISPDGMQKFKSQIERTHELFKQHIAKYRPLLSPAEKMHQVATGEHWYGSEALELGLIDSIQTSDEYLISKHHSARILRLRYHGKRRLQDKITESLGNAASYAFLRLLTHFRMLEFGQ